jgi:exodeoxyribonuclease III
LNGKVFGYCPNVVRKPGLTWTPTTAKDDPNDHHDFLDIIFVRTLSYGNARVTDARIVGEGNSTIADIKVPAWPSDYRAVVATVKIRI